LVLFMSKISTGSLDRAVQALSKQVELLAKNQKSNKTDLVSSAIKSGSKGVEVDMDIVKAQAIEKQDKQIQPMQKELDHSQKTIAALDNLRQLVQSLSTSAGALTSSVVGSTPVVQLPTNSPLQDNLSIQLEPNAVVGNHTLQVTHVASKQKYVIGGQDDEFTKNQKPFISTDNADIFTINGFSPGSIILKDSDFDDMGTPINLDGSEGLYDIRDKINAATPLVAASIEGNDSDGYFLVVESAAAGTINNFYIDPYDYNLGGAPSGSIAFDNIVCKVPDAAIQSVDIYTDQLIPFQDAAAFDGVSNEIASFNVVNGTTEEFLLGSYPVEVLANGGISGIAANLNRHLSNTKLYASVVPKRWNGEDGYVLRIEALYGSLPPEILKSPAIADRKQIYTSSAQDTKVFIDGKPIPPSASNTIISPTSDIASITVVNPVVNASGFSISENAASITDAITQFVDSINDAQQFAAQQSQVDSNYMPLEDSVLFRHNALTALQNRVEALTSIVVKGATLADIGITKTQFAGDVNEGLVPATYLKIDQSKLNAAIATNFTAVYELFSGGLDVPDTVIPVQDASIITTTTTLPPVGVANSVVVLASDDGTLATQTINMKIVRSAAPGNLVIELQQSGGAYVSARYNHISADRYIVTGAAGGPLSHVTFDCTIVQNGSIGDEIIQIDYTPAVKGAGGNAASVTTHHNNGDGSDLQYVSGSTSLDAFSINVKTDASTRRVITASTVSTLSLGGAVQTWNLTPTSLGGTNYSFTGDNTVGNPFTGFTISCDIGNVASINTTLIGSFQASTLKDGVAAKISLESAPDSFNVAQFDITVTHNNPGPGYSVTATDHSNSQTYNLIFTPVGTKGGIISAPYGTPFGGVLMQYTFPTSGIAIGNSDTISNIQFNQGVASGLKNYVDFSYLDPTNGKLSTAKSAEERIIADKSEKIQEIEKATDKRIIALQMKLLAADLKSQRLDDFLSLLYGGNGNSNFGG
jgi:flagellar capping protein FliD